MNLISSVNQFVIQREDLPSENQIYFPEHALISVSLPKYRILFVFKK